MTVTRTVHPRPRRRARPVRTARVWAVLGAIAVTALLALLAGMPGTRAADAEPAALRTEPAALRVALLAGPAPAPTPTPMPGIPIGPGADPAPVPTPDPSPGPVPTPPAPGGADRPGLFDIPGQIRAAIDAWLAGLVVPALNPVLDLLGRTVLATPDVTGQARVRELWTACAVAANSVLVLFILVGGILVMSRETVQTRYSVKEIAPRLVVGVIAANASLGLAGVAIRFANALSAAVMGPGVDPADTAQALRKLLVGAVTNQGGLLGVMGLVAVVLAVVLLATYLVRVAVVTLLVAGGPLALVCHAHPCTEGVAKLWWRGFFGCLAIQVGQSLTLITALRVFFTPDGLTAFGMPANGSGLVNLLVACCLLYLLVKIPVWVTRVVFGRTPHSTVLTIIRYSLIYGALRQAGVLDWFGGRAARPSPRPVTSPAPTARVVPPAPRAPRQPSRPRSRTPTPSNTPPASGANARARGGRRN